MAQEAKPLFNYQIKQPSVFYSTYGIKTHRGVIKVSAKKNAAIVML